MTAAVVDQPDKQQHQQQDHDRTSKQHVFSHLQPEHNGASRGGTEDKVAVTVPFDIPTDAGHQTSTEEDPKKGHSGGFPEHEVLSAGTSHAKTKKTRRRFCSFTWFHCVEVF